MWSLTIDSRSNCKISSVYHCKLLFSSRTFLIFIRICFGVSWSDKIIVSQSFNHEAYFTAMGIFLTHIVCDNKILSYLWPQRTMSLLVPVGPKRTPSHTLRLRKTAEQVYNVSPRLTSVWYVWTGRRRTAYAERRFKVLVIKFFILIFTYDCHL